MQQTGQKITFAFHKAGCWYQLSTILFSIFNWFLLTKRFDFIFQLMYFVIANLFGFIELFCNLKS